MTKRCGYGGRCAVDQHDEHGQVVEPGAAHPPAGRLD